MEFQDIYSFNLNNKDIQITQEIKDFHIGSFIGFEGKHDVVQMEIEVRILCQNEYANITYYVLLNKFPNEYAATNDEYIYYKYIYRKNVLSEIKLDKNETLALYLVSIIESICNNPTEISQEEFDKLNVKSIFDLESKNWHTIQYGIFYMADGYSCDYTLENETTVNHRGLTCILKLLPIGNINVYNPNPFIIKDNVSDIFSTWKIAIKGEKNLVFSGSFEECLKIFRDSDLLKIEFDEFKREKSMFDGLNIPSSDDSDRNYFDTITDGNLGDFDDFNGNNDDLDVWSRG